MTVPEKIYPGKMIRLEATFDRAEGESFDVNPSIVTLTLQPPLGGDPVTFSSELLPDDDNYIAIDYDSPTSLSCIARYTIPRSRASGGVWGGGWHVTGNLNTARDFEFKVELSVVL